MTKTTIEALNWAEDALERAGHSPNGPEMMAFYEARANLAALSQPEAQQPEAVAFDFFGLFDFLDAAHAAIDRDKTEGSHGAGLDLWRKRVFNAAVLQKNRGITRPTHDGGDVMGTAENLRQVVCVKG